MECVDHMEPKFEPNGLSCEWPSGGFPEHHFTRWSLAKGVRFSVLTWQASLLNRYGIPDTPDLPNPCKPFSRGESAERPKEGTPLKTVVLGIA